MGAGFGALYLGREMGAGGVGTASASWVVCGTQCPGLLVPPRVAHWCPQTSPLPLPIVPGSLCLHGIVLLPGRGGLAGTARWARHQDQDPRGLHGQVGTRAVGTGARQRAVAEIHTHAGHLQLWAACSGGGHCLGGSRKHSGGTAGTEVGCVGHGWQRRGRALALTGALLPVPARWQSCCS